MNYIINKIRIIIYESTTFLLNFYFNGLSVRIRLLKKRLPGFLWVTFFYFIFYTHLQYVFFVFATTPEAGPGTIYDSIIYGYGELWYVEYTDAAFLWLKIIYWGFVFHFILTSFSLYVYATFAQIKDYFLVGLTIGFVYFNSWFAYIYMFYVCQENVIVLALVLYNFTYWVCHFIMWDEELDAYLDDQAERANEGRENFVHVANRQTTDADVDDEYDPYDREGTNIDEEEAKELWWNEKQKSEYIDIDTLEVGKSYADSNVVENLINLEARYAKHLDTFYPVADYATRTEDYESKIIHQFDHYDPMLDFLIVPVFLLDHSYAWEYNRFWRYYKKIVTRRKRKFLRFHNRITFQIFKPKVVGPYKILYTLYKPEIPERGMWFFVHTKKIIRKVARKLILFFSLRQRYQNVKWFFFKRRFWPKVKKLKKKRKTINYIFFKEKKENNI